MKRISNWRSHMDRWVIAHAADRHVYGRWDCALMAASHIDNLTGSSHFAAHVAKYNCAESASAYLASLGIGGLGTLADVTLGAPLKTPKLAHSGDIVLFETDLGPALGIIDLPGTHILGLDPSETGFIRHKRARADAAWRV